MFFALYHAKESLCLENLSTYDIFHISSTIVSHKLTPRLNFNRLKWVFDFHYRIYAGAALRVKIQTVKQSPFVKQQPNSTLRRYYFDASLI